MSLNMSASPRFHRLAVDDLRRESRDAVSLTFAIPQALADDYRFNPGQYVTWRTMMDGEEVRRSYSICSGPDDGELRIAVKKVDGGAFSNWAADELKPGDEITLYTKESKFTYIVKNKRIVDPTDVSVLQQTTEATLTLITCYPYLVDSQRMVVFAQWSG